MKTVSNCNAIRDSSLLKFYSQNNTEMDGGIIEAKAALMLEKRSLVKCHWFENVDGEGE